MEFIVIDPRRTDVAAIAEGQQDGIWLNLRSGSNIPLINSILNVIFEENLHDEAFIKERCDNFEHIREHVKDYAPDAVQEVTGVDPELVRKAARKYAKAENAMILYGLGVAEHKGGTAGVMALANLVLATGHVGKPYNGINPLRGQNNVQGACDMGTLPYTLPGYQATDDEKALEKFARAWGIDTLPVTPGLLEPEMYDGALKGTFKGLYCVGYDPAHTQANINHVQKALKAMDFVVVQDMFMTETAKFAHVVLPAACFYEKDGTFSSGERRVRRVRKAVNAPDDAKADWEIICLLSQAMGYPMFYTHPEHIMEELSKLTPPYTGISYKRLDEESSQTWPCPEENHPGVPLLHTTGFPIGKGRFQSVSYIVPEETADKDYPLVLITGRRVEHYNNGSMTRRCEGFDIIAGHELVEINPDDAAALGIQDGSEVRVESRRGSVRAFARVTQRSQKGNVFMTFHFEDSMTNILTSPGMDTKTMTPEYKVAAVNIKAVK